MREFWSRADEEEADEQVGARTEAAGERADERRPPKAGERAEAAGERGRRGVDLADLRTVSLTSLQRLLLRFSVGLPVRVEGLPGMASWVGC